MPHSRWVLAAVLAGAMLAGTAGLAEDGAGRADPQTVVAFVGGEPIHAADVDRLVARAAGGKEVAPSALPALQAQALEEIVQRRLALAAARRAKESPSAAEVQAALAGLKAALEAQKRTVEDYLQEQGAGEADLRRQVEWNLLWPKVLARHVTDDRAAAHFEAHRREFDGTELSVSHVLLKPGADAGADGVKALVRRAEAIREEVRSSKLSFAEAARKYSQSPTAAAGGSIGFIPRRGVMVESFSKGAFALRQGEISPPVVSPFGVHLIRCDAVKPGGKTLSDVRPEVDAALARELLDKLAEAQRPHTVVKYTGAGPYFKPGTREVVGGAP